MMPYMDRSWVNPAYRQIAALLRDRITDGTYRPGTQLPSLRALQAETGHAIMTIRRAIAVLADEGLVRTVGKGTYVR
jgi:DNA-binding GntR family transcriptional regulator